MEILKLCRASQAESRRRDQCEPSRSHRRSQRHPAGRSIHRHPGPPPDGAASTAAGPAVQPQVNLREQDHHCRSPTSFVSCAESCRCTPRLPTMPKIRSISEYISFITREANERCKQEHRKTITAEDMIWAMGRLVFDHYVAPLSLYLQRYRENQGDLQSGLHGEDFPIIKHRHRPPITNTVSAPVHHAQPLQIRSSMPPLQLLLPPPPPLPLSPPPSSSLDVPPSAPPRQPSL